MKVRQDLLVIALGVLAINTAHAGFYVNDDAPVVTAAHPEAARKDKTVYVSFSGTKLQGSSRGELESTADVMPNPDSVVITASVKTAKQLASANRRVASVRSALIRRGVSTDRIASNAEVDPLADALDTDVKVIFRSSTQRPSLDSIRAARFVQSAPAQPVQPAPVPTPTYPYAAGTVAQPGVGSLPTMAQQGQNLAKLEFVKKIMAMASNKLISQESAVKLVNEYLSNMSNTSTQFASTGAQQAIAPIVPSAPQIVPFGEVPRVWTLAANKSLRDNVRDWAIAAGYGEPAWMASNLYQVTYTSTYTGTFVEVLGQLANSVPSVDFRLSRNARRLEVVDHL